MQMMDAGLSYVSDLVRDAGERRAKPGRAHLGELDRNDSPCTHHAKLQPERAGRKSTECVGQGPERDECPSKHDKDDDGKTATDVL